MSKSPFPWTDVSIDLETLSHKYNAPILSIGAVAFNRDTGKTGPTFYQEIDIDSAIRVGTVTGGTVAWWITQNRDAKRIFDDNEIARAKKMHLASALLNFTTFVRSLGTPRPWGNGATFDITIIEHSIDRGSVGLEPPWAYWNIRDVRTVVDAAESLAGWKKDSVKRVGVHHNALDDATYQAHLVIEAWRALKPASTKAAKTPVPATQQDDDDEL
jgi:hypothetical protein